MRGSLINRIGENSKSPAPEVGMGLTIFSYTDRSAGTIVSVSKSGKRFKFQVDKAIRADKNGMSDSQDYTYEAMPGSKVMTAFKTKNGTWKIMKDGRGVALGYRNAYHDFSF